MFLMRALKQMHFGNACVLNENRKKHSVLNTTIVVFNPFYQPFKSQLLGTKCVFKHQDLQMFGSPT